VNEDIRRALADAGCRYRVHRHETLVSTEDFLRGSRLDPDAVVKTLAFRTPDGGYALAVLRALDKLDYKSLADALGVRRKDLRAADPGALAGDLGFEVGGVSPIAAY
jgi:Cys-tRNA(Pro)/Cys-tRNA(Cys) deacylase